MTDELERLRASLAQLASETRSRQGDTHPSPEELISYSAHELPQDAAEAILEHLAVCRPCARLVLGIPAFLETPPDELGAASSLEADTAWQALRARLPREPAGRSIHARPRAIAWLGSHEPRPATLALAACLAGSLIGFSLWIATHGRSQAAPPIVIMNLSEGVRRGATGHHEEPVPVLDLDAEASALVLYLPPDHHFPRYSVVILPAKGKPRTPAAVAPISPQALLVLLTYRELSPGEYRLHVSGIDSGQTQFLGEYPLKIAAR
jgi:anti-sigma factor RsiW